MEESKIDKKIIEEFSKQLGFPVSSYCMTHIIGQAIERNRVYQETKKDLEINPKFKEYFSQYRADTIPEFIHSLATHKARLAVTGNSGKSLQTGRILDPKERAEKGLWEIQQKKMFIMQCLWRAEKIEIPEIKVCHEFQYWEHNIKNCHFLEPITEEEVELYIGYILTDDYTFDFDPFSSMQDYEGFKDEYTNSDDGGYMPEWYSYYDIRKGTGSYLILPDVRGSKEKKYQEAFFKNQKKEKKAAAKLNPPKPPSHDYYQIMDFVIDFFLEHEDEATIELMKKTSYNFTSRVEREEGEDYDDEPSANGDAREALGKLEYTPFKIPIAGYYDWKQGLARALYKYETQQVADTMKLVFEDYNMRREMGIPFESDEHTDHVIKQWEKNRDSWRETILKGRELLGEPRDFDI